MKIKPKFPLSVRPDKNGEYSENVGRMLIRARLADEIEDDELPVKIKGNNQNRKKR